MSEKTGSPLSFHLFNCDNTYDLDNVEKLIKAVAGEVQVHQTYFPLPRMTQLSQELEGKTMDCAVFVVHAYESRLSINEPRAGIGYAKVYRALLNATEGRVLIVIGGDDNYKTQEERDTSVLSQWARGKVSSQFMEEYMNGSRSFIFSWDEHHHPIHEDALQHFLDPGKTDEFVPKPRPLPPKPQPDVREQKKPAYSARPHMAFSTPTLPYQGQPCSAQAISSGCGSNLFAPTHPYSNDRYPGVAQNSDGSIQSLPIKEAPFTQNRSIGYPGHASQITGGTGATSTYGSDGARGEPRPLPYAPLDISPKVGGLTQTQPSQTVNKGPSLQVFTWTSRKETLDIVHNFMSSVYNNLSLPGPPDAPSVSFDGILSHLIKAKLDYAVAAVEKAQIERVVKDFNLRNLWRTRLESFARYIGKKAIILVCDDETNTGQMTSGGVLDVIQHIMSPNEANDKLLVMSWFMKPGVIHMDALTDILRHHGDVRSEHIRQGGGGGHGRDEHEEYRKQVEIERQIQDAIRDEQKKKSRAAQYQHESLPCTTDYQDLRKGGPGSEKLSSAQPKLCYQALLQHGRVAGCLVRDPPTFKVPQEMLQDALRLNLDKAQTLEIWDLGGKLIRTERIFDEFHRVLRYRATMEYGKLAYPDHVYPPGSQPPQYILDDMISRNSQVPKAVLTIWENGQGGLTPVVETESPRWRPSLPTWRPSISSFSSKKKEKFV
ncbi:uncharacterized protein LOC5503224 isoform X2 [Nematostella vectensis]|uniref:uncharacterized protein LOC5503224 isoform X2 n=1 Tax=Nematostella vectensis TaxID=45351 RepID=UPI0020770C88|nr:uncharacterized protein LOC5503224 isoform X2 [Nematostella vectensis]